MKQQILVGILVTFLTCAITVSVQAQDIRDQLNIQTGKAELVIADMDPNAVASQIKEAVSQFAIPINLSYRLQPSEIPVRPDQPLSKQVFIQGKPAVEYQCPTAYAEILKTPPPVSNAFTYVKEILQVCLYSFQKGTKAYLFFTRGRKTESLTGGIFGGITQAIQGTDGERIENQLQENIAAIKKNIPTLLVERIEVPGMPQKEPDKAAVAALIPAKSVVTGPAAIAPVYDTSAKPIVPVATNSQQIKIEARKNLTAMGMTYHLPEQFFAAIRRKDDVAVQLFLDADGIDLTNKDANGKTPLNVANAVGAVEVVALIEAKLAKKMVPLAPVDKPVQKPVGPSSNGALLPNSLVSTVEAANELTAKDLSDINAQIDALKLPADKKEIMRENAIRQVKAIRAMVGRIDQNTGQLK